MSRLPVAVILLAVALATAACSPAGPADTAGVASPAANAPAAGFLVVTDAWVRAAPQGATTAGYLRITNGTAEDDALVGVAASAASTASLHETTTEGGMTGMRHAPSIPVKAGATVTFEPGGLHVMLEGLSGSLRAGDTVRLELSFERAGTVDVTAEVRAG